MTTQFTPPLMHQITPLIPSNSNPSATNTNITDTNSWLKFPTSKKALGGFSLGDGNCMEQLLVHCANAIESNDVTLAQQILWVLNNIAPPDGDSNQRLASTILRALTSRAAKSGSSKMLAAVARAHHPALPTHTFSVIDFASFVDVTPWHRFGFTAANSAILEATEGFSVIHIVDLSLTRCMQIPTLIDAIASRHNNHNHSNNDVVLPPPLIKLTVASLAHVIIPPTLDLSYDELGTKLVNFARSKNVTMEFTTIPCTHADGLAALIHYIRAHRYVTTTEEALIINCHMMLHCIPDETLPSAATTSSSCLRSMFLTALRGLDPTLVVLVEEDADLTSCDLVGRLRSAFNYMWIMYDTVDTFLARGSKQRQWYEGNVRWKIENVIAEEGIERVERLESKSRWERRMREAEFQGIGFSDDAVSEVKGMLEEHAAGCTCTGQ
ncbi:scarecrow-like protein 32 [Senna tora]|uniref:Scarecrow-like protein 32 n=1 Tax=Senna tora TaxID=362788 RepID=A0A834SXU1_9FABA|nr:scarecrow-like protein 32 [Senna tora]